MIEVATNWVLIFYTVVLPLDGGKEERSFHLYERGFETHAKCEEYGHSKLALIDVPPGVNPNFACIPIEALNLDPETGKARETKPKSK